MFTSLLFTASFGKWIDASNWELDEPMFFPLDMHLSSPSEEDSALRAAKKDQPKKKLNPKHIVTQDEMDKSLKKTDCSAFVTKQAKKKMVAKGSERCWNCPWSVPSGCSISGWVKYSDFHIVGANVGHAGVSVDDNNHIGMTVSDVSFHVAKTPFTVQPRGLFTIPCSGILEGVISGAVSAVEAVINLSAEGVPIIGEAAASPVDGAVVDLKHVLTGVCAVLEDIIEDVLGAIVGLLKGVLGNLLPDIINDLLKVILGSATGTPVISKPSTSLMVPQLQIKEGWTRIV